MGFSESPTDPSSLEPVSDCGHVPLRPDELCDILGISLEEVDRALTDLEAQGVICREQGGLRVLDAARLRAIGK